MYRTFFLILFCAGLLTVLVVFLALRRDTGGIATVDFLSRGFTVSIGVSVVMVVSLMVYDRFSRR